MIRSLRNDWRLLTFGALMTFWSAPGQTFFIALFGNNIRADLALTHAEFGGLYSAATLLSAVVILWSGRFADSIPIPRLTRIVVLLLALSMVALGLSSQIWFLFIAFFLLRQLGQSLMMLIASTTMLRYLSHIRGKASALSSMGYIVAEATLPMAVVLLSTMLDWRQTLFVVAIFMLLAMLIATPFLLGDYNQRHSSYLEKFKQRHSSTDMHADSNALHGDQSRHWTRPEVLRDPRFYLLLPVLIAQALLFTGFIFHQGFIVESKGWSWQLWASLFSVYAAIALTSKLITGVVIDRFSALSILPFSTIPLALGLGCLALGSSNYHALGFFIGLGITAGIQTTLTGPTLVELYGDKHLGAIKSLSSSLIAFGTALTPFAMGWFIDRGASIEQLSWSAVIYLVVALLLVLIAKHIKPGYHNQ